MFSVILGFWGHNTDLRACGIRVLHVSCILFHVAVPAGGDVTALVLVELTRPIDERAWRAKRIGVTPEAVVQELLSLSDAYIMTCCVARPAASA